MTDATPARTGRRRAALIGGFGAVVVAAVGITATAFAGSTSFTDDFSDGNTSGWSKSGGDWAVVGQALQQSNSATDLARMFAGDSSWTDYTVQAKVRVAGLSGAGGSAGVVARATGSHQFERLSLVAGSARLEEVKGSAVTTLGSLPLASAATGVHTLRLDVVGTQVRGYVDGTLVGNASGRTLKAGRIGLVTTTASASFDDVAVTAVAATPSPTVPASPTVKPTASPTVSPTVKPTATASPSATVKPTATAQPTATTAPVSTSWPTPKSTTTLTATRKITGSFDGGNVQFVGAGDLGGSDQSEGQDPLFDLADGATLSNVIIGSPAADGVHCLGSCTLKNVWWLDVGEDAATFKGTSASQTMTVDGGGAMHAADKVFQHNGPGTFIIKNFQAGDIGKLYRSCGNCSKQFARHVEVSNVTVTVPLKVLVGINPNLGDTAKVSTVRVIGGTSKTVICASFQGVTSGEPKEVSTVPNATCTATGITLG